MSDEAKQAQILTEFVSKCVHIVVAYRIARENGGGNGASASARPSAASSSSPLKSSGALNTWVRKSQIAHTRHSLALALANGDFLFVSRRRFPLPQFNLETHDDESLCSRLSRWRDQPLTPLVIELFFEAGTPDAPLPTLLERWSISYHPELVAVLEAPAVYKRVVLLCRTLVAQLLLLPAHSVCKLLRKHKLSPSRISFQVKTHASPGVDFAMPSRSFRFADIATPRGAVRLIVDYLPDCSAFRPAMPQSEQVLILNYDPSAVASGGSAGSFGATTAAAPPPPPPRRHCVIAANTCRRP
jgi:hypothetical protein